MENLYEKRIELSTIFNGREVELNVGSYFCIHGLNGSGKTQFGKKLGERKDCFYHDCLFFDPEVYETLLESYPEKIPEFKKYLEDISDFMKVVTNPFRIVYDRREGKLSVYELSDGEKNLIMILLVVCLRPEPVIIFDLPETHLHIVTQEKLKRFFQNHPKHIIAITHSPSIVRFDYNQFEDVYKNTVSMNHIIGGE